MSTTIIIIIIIIVLVISSVIAYFMMKSSEPAPAPAPESETQEPAPVEAPPAPVQATPVEEESAKPIPIDCQVSDWSNWSSCDNQAMQTRTRTIIVEPYAEGKLCPSLIENRTCKIITPSIDEVSVLEYAEKMGYNHIEILASDNPETRKNKLDALEQLKAIVERTEFNDKPMIILNNANDSLVYYINVEQSGNYNIEFEVLAPGDNSDSLSIDFKGQIEDWIIPKAENAVWRNWKTNIFLNEGIYKMTIKHKKPVGLLNIRVRPIPANSIVYLITLYNTQKGNISNTVGYRNKSNQWVAIQKGIILAPKTAITINFIRPVEDDVRSIELSTNGVIWKSILRNGTDITSNALRLSGGVVDFAKADANLGIVTEITDKTRFDVTRRNVTWWPGVYRYYPTLTIK